MEVCQLNNQSATRPVLVLPASHLPAHHAPNGQVAGCILASLSCRGWSQGRVKRHLPVF